jgi:CoA:oxalate CoA-transferase
MVHAASGYDLALMGYQPSQDMPAVTGIFVADVLGGLYANSAIQTALFQRERTGLGQRIDTTLIESMLNLLIYEMQFEQQPSEARRPRYGPLRTLDGFVIVLPINANNFMNLCEAVGHPEWADDPLFKTPGDRIRNWDQLMARVQDWTAVRSVEDCEAVLLGRGVPTSRYQTIGEAMADPQLAHRGSLVDVEDAAGTFRVVNPPFTMSGAVTCVRAHVPGLGEHTEQVLRDTAGFSTARISELRGQGGVLFGA